MNERFNCFSKKIPLNLKNKCEPKDVLDFDQERSKRKERDLEDNDYDNGIFNTTNNCIQTIDLRDFGCNIKFSKDHSSFTMTKKSEVPSKEQERYKIPSQEKEQIKQEFSEGIPIKRVENIFDNYKNEDEFIKKLRSFYKDTVLGNQQRLTLSGRKVNTMVQGYDNMIYMDKSISRESIRKLELLLGREINVIKAWRKPQRKPMSGEKVLVMSDGIVIIKKELENIPIHRLEKIIKNYNIEDSFFRYITQVYKNSLNAKKERVRIPSVDMNKFITSWENFLYAHNRLSKEDFNKVQMLVGKENPIPYKFVYGQKNLEVLKLIENEAHAELIGTFIVSGSIMSSISFTISYGRKAQKEYIDNLKRLILNVYKKQPNMQNAYHRFQISGQHIIQYLALQGLSNTNKRVPSWIKKSSDNIRASCLRGMINGGGSKGVNKRKLITITFIRTQRGTVEDFRDLCNSLGINTASIKEYIHKNAKGDPRRYNCTIAAMEDVKKFLYDVVKPLKWESKKHEIQRTLKNLGSSIEIALLSTYTHGSLKREHFRRSQQEKTLKISYEDYLRLVNERDDLEVGMSREQFETKLEENFQLNGRLTPEKRKTPSKVELIWRCSMKGHYFPANYSSVKYGGSGCGKCHERVSIIGTYAHPIIEYYSLIYFRKIKDCKIKSEKIVAKTVNNYGFKPDLLIDRDFNFREEVEKFQTVVLFPSCIVQVSIDFTFGLMKRGIFDKCFKKYQDGNRFLIIVMMRERGNNNARRFTQLIQNSSDVNMKEHIKVINFEEYLTFLSLQSEVVRNKKFTKEEKQVINGLRNVRTLGINAIENDSDLAILRDENRKFTNL